MKRKARAGLGKRKKAGYQRLDKGVNSSLRSDKRELPNKIAHA